MARAMNTAGSTKLLPECESKEGSVTNPTECVMTRLPATTRGTGMYQNHPSSQEKLAIGWPPRPWNRFQSPFRDSTGRAPTKCPQIAILR